jgi:hypothetical protein
LHRAAVTDLFKADTGPVVRPEYPHGQAANRRQLTQALPKLATTGRSVREDEVPETVAGHLPAGMILGEAQASPVQTVAPPSPE